jgi:hypothetical protein
MSVSHSACLAALHVMTITISLEQSDILLVLWPLKQQIHYNFNIMKINLYFIIPRTQTELSEADVSLALRSVLFS